MWVSAGLNREWRYWPTTGGTQLVADLAQEDDVLRRSLRRSDVAEPVVGPHDQKHDDTDDQEVQKRLDHGTDTAVGTEPTERLDPVDLGDQCDQRRRPSEAEP